MARLLVSISDPNLRTAVRSYLTGSGHIVDVADDYQQATRALAANAYELILADVHLGGGTLASLMGEISAVNPSAAVLISTDLDGMQEAAQAVKQGAFGIVRKPVKVEELEHAVQQALDVRSLQNEAQDLRGSRNVYYRTDYFVGESPEIKRVFELVRRVSRTDSSVVLTGETGTGKELIAGAIHYSSGRAARAFVKVNCAALPEQLLESELFGHERGAFTGADKLRLGRFELADGGSIFLDEIADMSASTQAKMLRVLQEMEFERLGGSRTIKVNVRVISATNRDLQAMVGNQQFREDLYFRLNVVTIRVPPLRERGDDIQLLAGFFLRKLSGELKKHVTRISPAALDLLTRHPWPGNVRELQNTIERAIILADHDEITPAELELSMMPGRQQAPALGPQESLDLEDLERRAIVTALERSAWVQSEAAKLLGVSRRVINYKIAKYGITHPRWSANGRARPTGLS